MNKNKKKSNINSKIKIHQEVIIPNRKKSNNYILGIICFFFAFLLYSNTLQHAYVLDDHGVIDDNPIVKKGLQSIPVILTTTYRYGTLYMNDKLYRPLSKIMFAIEWQLSPNNPFLGHFLNVLFYALSCLLLFIVLRLFFSKTHALFPFLITLLFAAHPIHTEVVANIKSRDEIMSFFFLMLTLYNMFIWFTKNNWLNLIIAVLMYTCAIFSKEGVITMLFIIPIIGFYFTDSKIKNILTGSLILVVPALLYILIRQQIISKYSVSSGVAIIDNFLIGAHDPLTHFATAVMLLGKYLLLLIIPYQLVCDYSFNQIPIVGINNIWFIVSFMIYVAMGIFVVVNFKKRNNIVFGILFFLITLSIYSNIFFEVGSSFAERFMFLPSLGLCISFLFFFTQLLKINDKIKNETEFKLIKSKPIFFTIFIIILIIFSSKTFIRANEWKNQETLFISDVKKSPNSAHMQKYCGLLFNDKANNEKNKSKKDELMLIAIDHYEKAITIYPAYASCYERLGLAWDELNNKEKALSNLNKYIEFYPNKAEPWNFTGVIYFKLGNHEKAIENYKKAISLDTNYAEAYFNLGLILGNSAKFEDAIYYFKKCIQKDSSNIKAYEFVSIAYQSLKKDKEATEWFEKTQIVKNRFSKIKSTESK